MVSRTPVAGAVAFVVVVVVNGAMSALVIEPLLEHRYGDIVAATLRPVPLVVGYGVIAAGITLVHRLAAIGADLRRALVLGACVGVTIFGGVHAVQAGYTSIDATGWIASGIADAVGPTVAMVALSVLEGRAVRRAGVAVRP
jgi:hypothetical protein